MCKTPMSRPPSGRILTVVLCTLACFVFPLVAFGATVTITARDQYGVSYGTVTRTDVPEDGTPVDFLFMAATKEIEVALFSTPDECPDDSPARYWHVITAANAQVGWSSTDKLTIGVSTPTPICWTGVPTPAPYVVLQGVGTTLYVADGPVIGWFENGYCHHYLKFPVDVPLLQTTGLVLLASLLVGSGAWLLRKIA